MRGRLGLGNEERRRQVFRTFRPIREKGKRKGEKNDLGEEICLKKRVVL